MAKTGIEAANEMLSKKTPVNRDDYLNRVAQTVKDDQFYNEDGEYSDDEIREMAGYVFDNYNFDKAFEEDWDGDYKGYNEFMDHFYDNFGDLGYERGQRKKEWVYPSSWDKYDVEQKENAIRQYLSGYQHAKDPDYKYMEKIKNEVYKNIDDYYSKKYNRKYANSRNDIWRERAMRLAAKYPDNAYIKNLALIASDPNGVDHEDLIEDIVSTFGLKNYSKRGEDY